MASATLTRHAVGCTASFGRKDATCPRCCELLAGSPSRGGWQRAHFAGKASASVVVGKHCCKTAGCQSVCTYGDW